ncbi:MAG TPA: glycosyltransferase, partial [Armatimonadota bacterium]|nr:glycosyltransferase [Armatimonadota bacterium]
MFVGGGTAGHATPCIAVSEALARRDPSTEFLFVGANRENDRRLFEGLSLPHV